ncbi:MAG: polysaccharide deacetylase family protein [Chloroflexi bacterium]|nr:polysaccharide deacetylase family protein [Chloroflexota bacterium]
MRRYKRVLVITGAVALMLGLLWTGGLFAPFYHVPVTQGPSTERAIALTFDDGPTPSTLGVLDTLAKYGVKATFFEVGVNVTRHPDISRQVIASGSEVGLHSYSHSYWLPFQFPWQSVRDIERGRDAVVATIGKDPLIFRAPHGKTSLWMRWGLQRHGTKAVGWDVQATDWQQRPGQEIAADVVRQLHPGAIILLHDGLDTADAPDRSAMLAALPMIIEQAQAQGYRFKTVAELLGVQAYR